MVLYLKKLLTSRKNQSLSENLQLRFLKQLKSFLKNGYNLLGSLERMKWDRQMLPIAERLISLLKRGVTLDKALEIEKFHYTITAYLYFVRESGNLLESIEQCIHIFQKRVTYKQTFQQIIRYPLLLLFIFTILLFFIKQTVLPSFMNIFHASRDQSPTIYYLIMALDYIIPVAFIIVTFITLLGLWWSRRKKNMKIESQIKIYQVIPIYRKYLKLQTSFQFATHLSSLLQTGMPLKEILNYMTQQKKLPIIAHYSSLMLNTLNKGIPITKLLPSLYFMEEQMTDIFHNNNDVNSLEKDLAAFAKLLSNELHRKIMSSLKFIQPIFFIVLGIFIISVYLVLMWPMFEMINQL